VNNDDAQELAITIMAWAAAIGLTLLMLIVCFGAIMALKNSYFGCL